MIYLNGKLVQTSVIIKEMERNTLSLNFLSEGEHFLKFYVDGCDAPHNDPRCLSIAISNFTMDDATFMLGELDEKFDKNWHGLERDDRGRPFRWISQNASIQIFNSANNEQDANISFVVWGYHKPKILHVYLNEGEIVKLKVSEEGAYNFALKLSPGLNELKFYSSEGCEVPAEVELSTDTRCLSFAFADLKII